MKEFFKKIGRGIVKGGIIIYSKLLYGVKVYGKENIPNEGALIFCGNHRNYLDAQLIVTSATRHIRFMSKDELRKNPAFRFLGVVFEAIYVKRDSKDITALKESIKTLKTGGCVGIFPEGTRNGFEKNDGQIKNGAAYLALKTGAKIVPIGLIGPAKIFSKNAIVYGKPLDLSKYEGKKLSKEEEEIVSNILKEEIIKLSKLTIEEAKLLNSKNSVEGKDDNW